MRIYDITRELMSTPPYPGDPEPSLKLISNMELGEMANTSVLTTCTHSSTHIDAPLHFFQRGKDISEFPLDFFIGECVVIEYEGILLGDKAEKLLYNVPERVLFKGNISVSPSAAFVMSALNLKIVGVEKDDISQLGHTRDVHTALLREDILILENLDLSEIKEGRYMLFAAPLKIKGSEASPVRAFLMERQIY